MTDQTKDKFITRGLLGYIAILSTAFTAMVSVVFSDVRSDIKDNSSDIKSNSNRITSVELNSAITNSTVQEHTKQIGGLLELYGNLPTFRQRK